MKVDEIIKVLENTKGLGNVRLLYQKQKQLLLKMEDRNNHGVMECLKREFTIALTHDSTFREPAGKIVLNKDGKVILPAVPFPEVKAKDVVSSSPSTIVHDVIVKELKLNLNDEEATLLIGFNGPNRAKTL